MVPCHKRNWSNKLSLQCYYKKKISLPDGSYFRTFLKLKKPENYQSKFHKWHEQLNTRKNISFLCTPVKSMDLYKKTLQFAERLKSIMSKVLTKNYVTHKIWYVSSRFVYHREIIMKSKKIQILWFWSIAFKCICPFI